MFEFKIFLILTTGGWFLPPVLFFRAPEKANAYFGGGVKNKKLVQNEHARIYFF